MGAAKCSQKQIFGSPKMFPKQNSNLQTNVNILIICTFVNKRKLQTPFMVASKCFLHLNFDVIFTDRIYFQIVLIKSRLFFPLKYKFKIYIHIYRVITINVHDGLVQSFQN